MAFLQMEDMLGSYEVIVFPKVFQLYAQLLQENRVLLIKGRVSIREDEPLKLIAESFAELARTIPAESSGTEPSRTGLASNRTGNLFVRVPVSQVPAPVPPDASDPASAAAESGLVAEPASKSDIREDIPAMASEPTAASLQRLGIRYKGHENDAGYKRILASLAYFHGSMQVVIFFEGTKQSMKLGPEYWVDPANEVLKEISKACGSDNMAIF